MLGLILALSGCIWVSDEEVAERTALLLDFDRDGHDNAEFGGRDCDDFDPEVHPGADEVPYDEVDNDCDEETPDDDLDGDGFDHGEDCDDQDASAWPGAAETCDGVDNDCDDDIDDGVGTTVYVDSDGDGYGVEESGELACEVGSGESDVAGDCDDEDAQVKPDATEVCDGIDNDCDEAVDDDDAVADPETWFEDADGDGYGVAESTALACDAPSNYADNASDCDDEDASVHSGGLETLGDDVDGDCDDGRDSFGFDTLDMRGSSDVRGPRLAFGEGGSDEVHVSWAAGTYDDEGTLRYDGLLVSTWDADDLGAGEAEFLDLGSTSSLGTTGEAFDFAAVGDQLAWARNFDGSAGRITQLDAYDRDSGDHGEVGWQQGGLYTLFDRLQLGFDQLGFLSAVGCGATGSGVEAAQLSFQQVVDSNSGGAEHAVQTSVAAENCEFDDGYYGVFYLVNYPNPLEYWYLSGSNFYRSGTDDSSGYQVTDMEVTWAFDVRAWVMPIRFSSTQGIYCDARYLDGPDVGTTGYTYVYPGESIAEADAAIAPSALVYGCAVTESGELALFQCDPLNVDDYAQDWVMQDPGLGTVEDCGITITGDSVAVVAVRTGDEIALGRITVP